MKSIFAVVLSLFFGVALLGAASAFGASNFASQIAIAAAASMYIYLLLQSVYSIAERTATITFCLINIGIISLPGIAQAARGFFPFYSISYGEADVLSAATIYLLYTTCACLAYSVVRKGGVSRSEPTQIDPSSVNVPAALVMYGMLCVVSLIGFRLIGPTYFLSARGALFLNGQLQTPIQSLGIALVHFAGFDALAIALILYSSRALPRRWAMFLVGGGTPVFFLVNNVFNLPRYMLFAYLICLIFIFAKSSSPKFKAAYTTAYFVSTVTLFPILSQLSRGQRGAALLQGVGKYYATSGDFDGLQSIINIKRWIDADGLQWGKQIISAVLVAVPRAAWSGKAQPTGAMSARHAGYAYTNISAPLPGEFYSDFGWPGVVCAGVLTGWALQRLDEGASNAKNKGHPFGMLFFGTVIGLISIIYRGSLIGVVGPCGLGIVLAMLIRAVGESAGRADKVTGSARSGAN